MPKTLAEYIESLDERPKLIWPKPPAIVPLKANPYVKPILGLKAVIWNIHGTLLHIDTGRLQHLHPQALRMQIALQKTIDEFNMWGSMFRKPGQPWESLLPQYTKLVDDARMVATKKKGDFPEVDSNAVWEKVVERLQQKEYQYDVSQMGDKTQLAAKIAYFFHASLQGVAAYPNALETLKSLSDRGIKQGLLDDAQVFTIPQLFRALKQAGELPQTNFFTNEAVVLSYRKGLRKPSQSLFAAAAQQCQTLGIGPGEILYVTQRLKEDLAVAKQVGFRTALFAADKNLCPFEAADVNKPELKPDRLITDLKQVPQIFGG